MAAPAGVNEGLGPEPEEAPDLTSVGTGEPAKATELAGAGGVPAEAGESAGTDESPGADEVGELAAVPQQAEAEADLGPEQAGVGADRAPERASAGAGLGSEDLALGEEKGSEDGKRRDLRPLAVAGIAFGIIALVGVAVGALAVITHGFRPKTVVTYRPAAVFSLQPGDCVDSGPNGLDVTRLSCTTAHDAEVFATFSLSGKSWPGQAATQQQAGDGCASRLSGYLNPQLAGAGLAQEFVYPDHAAWQAGERTVVCEVRASSGQLTGSVRG